MRYQFEDARLEESHSALVRWFRFDHFAPERAVTSYWMSTKVLLGVRIITTLYSTVVIWASIGTSAFEGKFQHYFAHFTQLTFIGLHAYLVTALYHHIRYVLGHYELRSFFHQPSIINYLFYYLYHTICVFNIITPIVYWCALSPTLVSATEDSVGGGQGGRTDGKHMPITVDWWITTSLHGVSFVLMITEVLLTRMKMALRLVILVVINVILYMLLTFIIYASTGWWVYSFLDWNHGGLTAAWYLGIGAAFVVVFFVMYLVHLLRDWFARAIIKEQ
ncbi:hypothetical protein BX666DRAFT_1896160 [Dichotomocladium elegans]|nr:hypothetical protein BX666DRAFT_1896160 [Dichotomocladium elegans]